MIDVSSEYMNLIYEDTTKVDVSINYGLYDLTGKSKATASSTDKQTFSNPANTLTSSTDKQTFSTLERNQWLLNGEVEEFPDEPNTRQWSWWSLSQSKDDGTFTANPKLIYRWQENHSAIGISLKFGDPIVQFKVSWYDVNNTQLVTRTYTNEDLTAKEYTIEEGVQNYRRIEVEVIKVLPNHYAKINSVEFGISYELAESLISLEVNENIDPNCQELASNQANIKLNNINDDFNKYSPNNKLAYLQEDQRFEITTQVVVNGVYEKVPLGVYYLKSWGNPSRYTAEFIANDLISKLDGTYRHSKFYTNATVETIINDLLSDYKLNIDTEQYTIADNVKSVQLTGYIPVCTYREALQQICFACGAVCKADRYGKLYMYRITETDVVETIDDTKKQFANDNEDTKYGAVQVTQYSYSLSDTEEVLYNDTVTGNQTITFDSPVLVTSVTGTKTSYTAYTNCIDIVGGSGTIVVKGKKYNIYEKQVTKVKADITLGITYQTLDISGIYLIGTDNTSSYVTNWLLNELDNNITQEFKWLGNPSIEIGDYVNVEVAPNSLKKAIITQNKFTYNGALLETSGVKL